MKIYFDARPYLHGSTTIGSETNIRKNISNGLPFPSICTFFENELVKYISLKDKLYDIDIIKERNKTRGLQLRHFKT